MTTITYLKQSWTHLALKYTTEEKVTELWQEIHSAYTLPSRHYHSIDHIAAMLKLAEEYKVEIVDIDTLQFSIFYHDIIYSALRKDNELKSAELARKRMQEMGCGQEQIDRCFDQIVATQSHGETDDRDLQFLLDFDLAILGAESETYRTYTINVRKEYSVVPRFLYRRGRKKVLNHFLEMPYIYKTEAFRTRCEDRAKMNMKSELNSL